MHPGDRHYRNQTVRLTDLAVTADVIEQITFENCQLIGPAIVVLLGNTELRDSGFDGDVDAILWPIGDRQQIIGAIALTNCSLIGCRFQRIGLAVPDGQMDLVRRGFGLR